MNILKYHSILLLTLCCYACEKSEISSSGNKPEEPSIQGRNLQNELKKMKELPSLKIWLCSHRGNTQKGINNNIPENSLSAIQQAIDCKADMIELDVRTTLDGVLVLMHDKTIERTTTGIGSLSTITYEVLKKYKLKSKSGIISDEGIPLLKDALKKGKGKIFFNLDIANKDISVHKIIEIITQAGMEKEVLLYTSTDKNYFMDLKIANSDLLFHSLIESREDIDYFLTQIPEIQVMQISTSNDIFGTLSNILRDNKVLAFSNIVGGNDTNMIVGNYSGLVNMINKHIGIIQTDYIELADIYLKSKGYR